MTFAGFSKETTKFLRGLEKNNDKAWFDKHRADYDAHYIEPAKAFVATLGPKLQKLSPDVHAEPRVNGSIFRINRDVRFSKDKRPYKDHLDLWFWQGPDGRRSKECPGYFFRLTSKKLIFGAGLHGFDKGALGRFREAVADDATGAPLQKILAKVATLEGVTVGETKYKRVPKPWTDEHPRAELRKHGSLAASWEGPHPTELGTGKLSTWCAAKAKKMAPLMDWIATHVTP